MFVFVTREVKNENIFKMIHDKSGVIFCNFHDV